MTDQILTTKEAAEIAGVDPVTIRYWIKRGYLGDVKNQNTSTGNGCGYKIPLSILNSYIHGWDIEKPRPAKVEKISDGVDITKLMVDKRSLKIAADNLRIAIEFAQEELSKIEALL